MDAVELFHIVASIRLPVCRKCEVCVWPEEVSSHLQGQLNGISRRDGREIQSIVQQWPNILHKGDPLPIVSSVIPQIVELKLYRNALLCQAQPEECQHIQRSEHAMKTHFSHVHPGSRGSRGAKCKAHRGQHHRELWKAVNCQRLFAQGRGSQFFEVEVLEDEPAAAVVEPPSASKIEQARTMLADRMAKIEDHERRIIEDGVYNAPSPWVTRGGFAKYLRRLDRDELLQSVATPDVKEEPVCCHIWEAMKQMIQQCQSTVNQHAGVFIRKEVMRTEEDQSRFVPIKGYQQAGEIRDKGRHWQQIVMFFVRTQQPHSWKSPQYKFSSRQQTTFQRLRQTTYDEVESRQKIRSPETKVNGDDENDSADGHGDVDEDEGQRAHEVVHLEGLPRACLDFCMALLCETAREHEYEHALVCALAVLAVDGKGWKGYDTYPPILSSVIKISRFMTIQHGFHGSRIDEQGEQDQKETAGCIDIVTRTVDRFMLRKSHGPMEWMLDLRTYGMKTMFSSTAPGYIDWHGDQIMFKDVQFTMSQFRGMVHQVVHDLRERMLRKVLDVSPREEKQLPTIPWDHLRDDVANAQPGWNFVKDRRNPWPVDGEWWLFDRLMKSTQYQMLQDGPDAMWDVEEVKRWLAEEDAVRELMLIAKHLTGGQPARAPEALSVCHSNTSTGAYRNMGIENGRLFEVVRYHKGFSMSGDIKIIHRYFPREVEELIVWWLWLVRP